MKKIVFIFILSMACFCSSAQIINGDFENWFTDSSGHARLNNWQHFDFGFATAHLAATWEVSDAEHGTHALELSRWYSYRSEWVIQKTSTASKPTILTGYYKYIDNFLISPYDIDTAVVYAWPTIWNSSTMQNDTIGMGKSLLMASSAYTPFTCPITYTDSRIPDSMIIFIKPSVWLSNGVFCRDSGYCSYLTIDNLSLTSPSEIMEPFHHNEVSVYLDAQFSTLCIVATNKINEIVIHNLVGQQVYRGQYNDEKIKVDISAFPAALFVVTTIDDEGLKTVHRVIK